MRSTHSINVRKRVTNHMKTDRLIIQNARNEDSGQTAVQVDLNLRWAHIITYIMYISRRWGLNNNGY